MKYLFTLLLLCGLCHGAGAATAPRATTGEPDASRFLFIVETTSSMRSLEEANRTALFDMIFTGLGGQMRTGDTFGIWTYNQDTHAGLFPMQAWDAENPMEVASRASLFLAGQKYGGEAHIDILAPKIRAVTRAVGDVTIFLISNGSTKLAEIPYFEAINTEYQQRAKERSRARKPFITALIARGGKVVGAYVALAGQPLPLPERPAPLVAAKTPLPPAPVPPKRSLGTVVPWDTTIPASALINGVTPAPELKSPALTPDSVVATKTSDVIIASTPAPVPALAPAPVPALALEPVPAAPRTKVFEFVTRTNSTVPKPESIPSESMVVATNPPPAPAEIMIPVPVIAKTEPPVASEPPEPPAPKPIPSTVAAGFPDALPVAARELEAPAPAETPRALNAAAVPVVQGLSAGVQLGIGGLLLASALSLMVVMLRRVRPALQPSLITRSMEKR